VVLLDSTPIECGRSRETAKRSALGDAAAYGCCRSDSRFFWGMRLHLACAPDGTPRAAALAGADRPEREVGLDLLARSLHGGEAVICDKGYAGREFALAVEGLGAQVLRLARRDEPDTGVASPSSASASSRSSGPARTCSPSSATAPARSRTCACGIATRLLMLAACISLNHQLGRPSRALVDYVA